MRFDFVDWIVIGSHDDSGEKMMSCLVGAVAKIRHRGSAARTNESSFSEGRTTAICITKPPRRAFHETDFSFLIILQLIQSE